MASKKIAIIGKLPSKFNAPYNDNEWEIWGCNVHQDMYKIPRYDKWFDIHLYPYKFYQIPPEKLILNDTKFRQECKKVLGGNYIANSMTYMVLYAVLRAKATHIYLYGCALNTKDEDRTKQLQNLREILFFCKGRGIKVYSEEKNVLEEYPIYE